MYKIIKTDGLEVGLTETPNYIYKHANGCYVLCDKLKAQGIAYNGTPYSLIGKQMDELEEVIVIEWDAANAIGETATTCTDLDAMVVDYEYRLIMLELGI